MQHTRAAHTAEYTADMVRNLNVDVDTEETCMLLCTANVSINIPAKTIMSVKIWGG